MIPEPNHETLGAQTPIGAKCPACGQTIPRRPVGRPRVGVSVEKVVNGLRSGLSVTEVAELHGISRASVYRAREQAERDRQEGKSG